MQKKVPLIILVACVLVSTAGCHTSEFELKEVRQLTSYPSGSALAFHEGRIYLAGDDVPFIMILNKELQIIDSVRIDSATTQRISKEVKPDFEAIASFKYKKKPALLLLGSGSKDPYRNQALLLRNNEANLIFRIDSFYSKLKDLHINDLNVEGAAAIPGGFMLSSRGNKGFRKNSLVYVPSSFFLPGDSSAIKIIRVGTNTDTSVFNGVSGLEYAAKSDKLLLTVSTENTYDSYVDGSIGKSYLWIINDITTRKRFSNLNPDRILDLEQLDPRFKGQKIESVCILNETRTTMELLFAADNDKGDSWLFKVVLRK